MAEAEQTYMRALRGYEKAWGAEHTSTLGTVNNLGLLYAKQGKMAEAEQMYGRATRRPLASTRYCGWLVAESTVHFRWI
jgi:Tfp pilus assembly protein PilF